MTFYVILRNPSERESVEKVLGEGVLEQGYMLRYTFTNLNDFNRVRIAAEAAKFYVKVLS